MDKDAKKAQTKKTGILVVNYGPKYPWQEVVLEAFIVPRNDLAAKVNRGERAIAARLKERPPPDHGEMLAIKDALYALQALMESEEFPRAQRKRKDIA